MDKQGIPAAAWLLLWLAAPAVAQVRPAQAPQNAEYESLQAYFDRAVARRHQDVFRGINSVQQWEPKRKQTREALRRMLWHNLRWPSAPPVATITHRAAYPGYTLENLVIETAPGLFLTANLYLPQDGAKPYPVVLYQCGHASKRYYARHGAWFATHGIAALVMDNIEMGEVEFTHHGVYSNAWFHWYSRGFSPLAVELWNARRAVDYLAVRPEVDPKRIGATGRSGGGMTTYFLAALDERIAASAPVSGVLSSSGWVKQRLSFAHCDCQYPVNSRGMLYAEVGALIAPRAQLLCNADADPGFPMNAFTEMVEKTGEIYRLYGAEGAMGTAVTPGGHVDSEAIRLPVYNFFRNYFLGASEPLTSEGSAPLPKDADLVCFRDGLPFNERLTRIDEEFIPLYNSAARLPREELAALLRREVFGQFPEQPAAIAPEWGRPETAHGRIVRRVGFTGFEGVRVKAVYSLPAGTTGSARLPALLVVDHRRGIPVWGNEQPLEHNQWGKRAVLIVETLDRGSRALERNLRSFSDNDPVHHMKRQAMVMGTTLESMQVYEILRSLELLRSLPNVDGRAISVTGKGEDGVNGLYAALLDGEVQRIVLASPPATHRQGPHYLGILRHTDIAPVARLLPVRVMGEAPATLPTTARCKSLPECLQ